MSHGTGVIENMRPDFSGEYVLNRAASTLSPHGAANVGTARLRIKHDEPTFGCEGKFFLANGETSRWNFELATDQGPQDGSSVRC
jgi:hypothetical protein